MSAGVKVDEFSAVLSALADPTRRAIVSRLARGEASVNELAEPFELTLPAVSKHLRVLRQAGLITQSRVGPRRPCRLNSLPLKQVADWAETFRATWEDSYARLDGYMREVQEKRNRKGE